MAEPNELDYCDVCGDELEQDQIGLCDGCADEMDKDEDEI